MAVYEIQGANGELYEIEGPDDADPSALVAQLSGGQPAAPAAPAQPAAAIGPSEPPEGYHFVTINGKKELRKDFGFSDAVSAFPLTGILETGIQGVTGLASKAASGLMGMFGAPLAGNDAATGVIEDVQDRFTYQPKSTAAGDIGALMGDLVGLFDPAGKAVESGISKLGPEAEMIGSILAEALPDIVPMAASLRPVGAAMRNRPIKPVTAPEPVPDINPVIPRAREAGYKVRPSDVRAASPGAKVPGTFREKLNDADLQKDLTVDNQLVTTRHAAADLGLRDMDRLDESTLENAKLPHVAVYKQAEEALNRVPPPPEFNALLMEARARAMLPDEADAGVTRTIGALRRKSAKQMQSDDVKVEEQGFLNRQMADRLEDAFGARLQQLGEDELLGQYQMARKGLAKIHDVETATRAGQVDAQILYKLAQKGVPLTGRLKLIAETAEHLPNVTRSSLRTAAGGLPRESLNILNALPRFVEAIAQKVPGLDVRSETFQNQFGKANPARASYFDTYGEAPDFGAPRAAPAPQLGTGDVDFMRQGRVTPPPLANSLAGDLGLVPDDVPNAQRFPPPPDMLTADVVPPIRGDIDFQAQRPPLAQTLAQDIELARNSQPSADMIDWENPMLGDLMGADELSLAKSNIADDLIGQLGFDINTMYSPIMEGRPGLELARPPGRAGKPRKK